MPRVSAPARPACGRVALVALLGLLTAGCVPTRWDTDPLAARYPALGEVHGQRLGDATPYLLPLQGELISLLCRWEVERIPVSLPPDASPEERHLLELALRSWERALGVVFAQGAPAGEGIEIRFVEAAEPNRSVPRAAGTISDCAVSSFAGERLEAHLVFASIHLHRYQTDVLGRSVAHTEAELAGTALHEIGHALGLQGHVQVGPSVMVRSVDEVRLSGRHLLRGVTLPAPTLRGLYALPSGTVVSRVPLSAAQTQPLDTLLLHAARARWSGPFVRVGDTVARIGWRDAEGRAYALFVRRVADVLKNPAELILLPGSRASALLDARTPGARAR